ncbi:PhoX family protein [Marinicellulosiphila megalodicopiae]|uniref:PhoX family protein n=1 Tax=Marinicellulosiphila megalodicopiae TaxID=2724896 RepID=UPI003BB01B28
MSKETFDPTIYNKSGNTEFAKVLETHVNRRKVLKGGAAMGGMSALGLGLASCASKDDDEQTPEENASLKLGFESIAGSKTDAVVVPQGYSAQVLAPWGEALNDNASVFDANNQMSALDQENAMGQNHDGMHFFPLNDSSTDGILCINHEYLNVDALYANQTTGEKPLVTEIAEYVDATRLEINAHGVSVVRVKLMDGKWNVVKNDEHNRRFTGLTEFDVTGPVTAELLRTKFSQGQAIARGTFNNCGNGTTPWGTYLTCEENWPGYFVKTSGRNTADDRIGIANDETRYGWEFAAGLAGELQDEFTRFDGSTIGATANDDYRNEVNGHGYIVEIDPYNPNSRGQKRTALGRFRHEGCTFGKLTEGKPVVFYSGHDSRFEYVYKFVSAKNWSAADADPTDRLATGASYMDEGTLYVAQFNINGHAKWLALELASIDKNGNLLSDSFASLAKIILNTAGAADLLGATPMDRPEWGAVDPVTGTVYMTMTNNTRRTLDVGTNYANPRLDNKFGHIIRWDESENQVDFSWDIFVFGSPETSDYNISDLSALNQFASPDGLAFDARGILWVQTDNSAGEVTSYTNDQMLAVIPSALVDEDGKMQNINADNQTNLKRFFVGPNGCEVTGIAMSPDNTTMFVNIQHPGNWPNPENTDATSAPGNTVLARSSTVVIRKDDGGKIGE